MDGFELLNDATNAVVARYEKRQSPGVLIQGDTLKTLFDDVDELTAAISDNDTEEARDIAIGLRERLLELLGHYERVLGQKGVKLPYMDSVLGSE